MTTPNGREPLVSILIPAFNAEDWIADTIRSAIGQTWSRKEVIIVDDGSTDGTLSVARGFASNEVQVVSCENQGASSARNTAYSHAQGDYIQWLDADDLLGRNKIESQLNSVGEDHGPTTLLSSAWGFFSYRPWRASFEPTGLWCDLEPAEWLMRKMEGHIFMQTSTWLTSRELAEAAGPWDTRISFDDDGEYFGRVLLASSGTRFDESAKVYYRNAASGRLSHVGLSSAKMDSLLLSMRLHISYLRKLCESERALEACVAYINFWSSWFDPEREDLRQTLADMANELGGELTPPAVRPKYRPIQRLLGHSAAWRAQTLLPHYRQRVSCAWDRLMARKDALLAPSKFQV